jgi:peptide/nickel transport system substrate-binding protein
MAYDRRIEMSKQQRTSMITTALTVLLFIAGCGATVEPVVVNETSIVVETVVVETTGETVVQEVTRMVERERVVTVTPEPEATQARLEAIHPAFKNPDTYLVLTAGADVESLDPAWQYDIASGSVVSNLYEGLVWYDREGAEEFIPALATVWQANEAGDVWTFQIREGVSFHDGGTLEPHDVAYTFHRALLQGRVGGPQWMTYEALFGSELAAGSAPSFAAAYAGKESLDALTDAERVQVCEAIKAAVVADDEAGTVTYYLHRPTPWFLALTTSFFSGIVDEEWMVENGDWDGACTTWQRWADPGPQDSLLFSRANGTGPYKLDHWTPGEEIALTAFGDYWRTEPMWDGVPGGPARIDRVLIKNIPEWGTRLSMFRVGDADYVAVPSSYWLQVEPYYQMVCDAGEQCRTANPDGFILAYAGLPAPSLPATLLNWQVNIEGDNSFIGSGELDGNGVPPDFFGDLHVRRAFHYCFDYETMLSDALGGGAVRAQGPIPAGMMGYLEDEALLYAHDPARCEEEFKLADVDGDGIPAGEDEDDVWNLGFYMQIVYNTGNDDARLISEILKAELEALNPRFSLAIVSMPWSVLIGNQLAGKLPISFNGWFEDYHDPHNWAFTFLHSQGTFARLINLPPETMAAFDALVARGASLATPEERRPVYEEIQRKAQEEAVSIWAFQPIRRYHLQPWIKGFYYNPAYAQPAYSWVYALSKEAP